MSEETTTEQLAEIEGQGESTPVTGYTPPEGWRVLQVGEELRQGDVRVDDSGACSAVLVTVNGVVPHGRRYIRPIEPQPEPEREPVQVREGRWRTRNGEIKDIRPCEPLRGADFVWPWRDGFMTYQDNGRHLAAESDNDLVEYLGPIEQQPKPQPQPQAAAIEELRSEVAYVQNLLGESRQRVTQLEELVTSLRTINRGCENAVRDAGKENFALKNQLAAVKAELASVAADRQRLRVELDAAQQVPADSPELQQLRAKLEQMTLGRDMYQDGYSRALSDLETIRETTKAETVEAIAEWLEPIRLVDHPNLANETLQHLPQIMRTLTGLDSHAID